MYKIAIPLLGLILVAIVALSIYPCRSQDYVLYKQLLASSNPESNENVVSCSQQTRGEVSKHLWYQGEKPLQIEIHSQNSELFFFKKPHQIEVVEHLEKVTCMMQEELFFVDNKPMQKIRYLEGEKANYNYNSQVFIAEDAKLWKYQIEGHILPEERPSISSLMEATAHSVEFTLKGEKIDFVAHQMRATVNSKEKTL